ncbi:site-specific DNA-methyltransferase [Pseudomonas alliivorans]|nr:site-specific DNA-methyltransferase [Pseudomonas alliivorans]
MNKPAIDLVTLQDGESANIVSENIEQLKSIFPEAFGEGGVNFDTLRQILGDAGVVDEGEEKYGLNWHGKKKARQIALAPSTGTLLPCPEESVDWDTSKNLFIEGDNLEVLKLLQKSYANKIKMIYIDPPYNTGKEFIYPDRFQENLKMYLHYTGQADDEGGKFSSNPETTGRKHSSWMSMIYPRLQLAKSLLRDDGLIFISIDDNEFHNLKLICDEVFGGERFVGTVAWKNKYGAGAKTKGFIEVHEYILCYSKSDLSNVSSKLSNDQRDAYNKKDDKYQTRGGYFTQPLMTTSMDDRKNLQYTIDYNGETISPKKQWVWAKDRLLRAIENNEVVFAKKADGSYSVRYKVYLIDENGNERKGKPLSLLNGPFNQEGTKEVEQLLGSDVFSFPKPSSLIEHFFGFEVNDEPDNSGIYLDFFSGSCTSAQAVLNLNCQDGGSRRYIMVQLPEYIDDKSNAYALGYKKISEIGRARLTKLSEKLRETEFNKIDLGFKSFKLSSSNIKAWNPDRADLEETLLSHQEHLVEGRSEQDILYELLLKRGIDLTVPIESRVVAGKNIYSIGYGAVFACLHETISQHDVEGIAHAILEWHAELKPASDTNVFFRDSAFNGDVSKTNMAAILEQNGITHVRSL